MSEPEAWIAIEATVTSCRFQFARLNTFTLGIPTGEKFRIAFDYYAHGRRYSDEFQSPTAIPQSTRIPLTYNPLHPEQNSRSSSHKNPHTHTPLISIGVMGSILLSLVWLLIVRGCRSLIPKSNLAMCTNWPLGLLYMQPSGPDAHRVFL